MRVASLLALLGVSSLSHAATWSGVAVREGRPVPGAQVTVFASPRQALEGCGAGPRGLLGTCLCPGRRDAFLKRARVGLPSSPPVTTTRTDAAGAFTVSAEGPGPFMVQVHSADGALAASARLGAGPLQLELVPTVVTRIRLSGTAADAVAYLFDWTTGQFTRLVAEGPEWVSPPLSSGPRTVLALAPGALPQFVDLRDGRLSMVPVEERDRPGAPEVTLAPPGVMQGRVLDAAGAVAGAAVVVDPGSCELVMRTDAAGAFSLPALFGGNALVFVSATAGGKLAKGYLAPARPAELSLKPTARLEVSFVDEGGAPMAGVYALVFGQEFANTPRPPSDAKGRWVVDDAIDGAVRLRVFPPYVLLSDPALVLKGKTTARLVVARGVKLEGRVVDGHGAPLAGATVTPYFGDALMARATEAMKDALRTSFITSGQGAFEFEGLVPGQYELVASSAQHGEATTMASAPGRAELVLQPRDVVEGEVRDAQGAPMAGVPVSVQRPDAPNASVNAATDAKGHFRAVLKGPGLVEVTVRGSLEGPQRVQVPGKALRFTLPPVPMVRGTVVDPAGVPVVGARVRALPLSTREVLFARQRHEELDLMTLPFAHRGGQEATTGPGGDFALPLPREGDGLWAWAELGASEASAVEVRPATPARLTLEPRSVATGRVLDWRGRPVTAFTVNGVAATLPGGRFEARLPREGTFFLLFDDPQSAQASRTGPVPATPAKVALGDIKLPQAVTITGRVVAGAEGRPCGTSVTLTVKSNGPQTSASARPDGAFVLPRVPAGRVELVAHADGFSPQSTRLDARPGLAPVALRMERPATVEVTVLHKGEPADRVDVEATGPASPDFPSNRRSVRTASDGRALLQDLVAGPWRVWVGTGAQRTVTLRPGEAAKLELSVP